MVIDEILNWDYAKEMTHIAYKNPAEIILSDDVIALCRMNACGNYNKSWTCPPNIGTLEENRKKILGFCGSFVIQNIFKLEDSFDFEGMTDALITHDKRIRNLMKAMKQKYPQKEIYALGCGGCKFCDVCAFPEPCRCPEEAMASVEGIGMMVPGLVESVGFSYINGVNTVSYVGMIFWR